MKHERAWLLGCVMWVGFIISLWAAAILAIVLLVKLFV